MSDEQPKPWASTEAGVAFFTDILNMTVETGQIVLECFDCKCGQRSVMGHFWQEAMACPHCNARCVSRTPRRPQVGEVTVEHMTIALETLKECYQNAANNIPDTTKAKWGELSAEMQLMITHTATRLVVSALNQVDNLAVTLAKLRK